MPEGDTIFRSARTLHLALAGKVVTGFTSVYPALTRIDEDHPIRGRIVTSVAFNVPIAEFLDERQAARQDDLRSIGPDLLGAAFDEDEAVRRLQQRGPQAVAEALLNQRVVAGIGNVYKSETLFLEGVHPATPVSGIDEQGLRSVLRTARKLLKAAAAHNGTHRSGRERVWVYGRGGKPCRKCGTPISYEKTGPNARGTYWCARCQQR